MCGGIGFRIKNTRDEALKKLFKSERIEEIKREGELFTSFWDPRPILPILNDHRTDLYDWGNRDPKIKLPKTGWAKSESVDEGRWAYLNPKPVVIPAEFGYEKGVWFTIDGGIRGLLIERKEGPRVYMLTKPASVDYTQATSHDRMPLFVNGDRAYSNPVRTGSFKYLPKFPAE